MIQRLMVLALGAVLVPLLLVACGDDDDDDDDAGDDDGGIATTAAGDGNGDGGAETFEVTLQDDSFDPDSFNVAAGAGATFEITNDGAAIHNMRVAGEDGEYETDDDAVSEPDTVRGGETAVLEWSAPSEAGDIDFRCDFHPDEMTGTITVE